jgi:hypothetical protein
MHSSLLSCLLIVGLASAATIQVNQVAFDQKGPKVAVVEGPSSLAGKPFTVTKDNQTVFTGTLGAAQTVSDWSSTPYFVARFDQLTTPGTYKVAVQDNGTSLSAPFSIAADGLLDATYPRILEYFQSDRSTTGDNAVTKFGDNSGTKYDVHGGWNDATGDVSKYLSHLSYANYMNPQQIPLSVWALALAAERIPAYLKSKSIFDKTRAEALWGADFLVRMQDPTGYFYITVFDGWDIKNPREICAFKTDKGTKTSEYQAAFREGAGMAIAALARVSVWQLNGEKTSADYLAAAKGGYAHLKSRTTGGNCAYCDDGKENIIDDYTALIAASELYKATNEGQYLTDARERATRLAGRISADGYFWSDDAKTRPFYHAADAGLPLVSLVRFLEIDSGSANTTVRSAISTHLSYLLRVTNKVANPFGYARQNFKFNNATGEGFFIPHINETGYWWQGENARLGSLSAAAFLAGRFLSYTPDSAFGVPDSVSRFGLSQLDWVLGRNPKGLCFMAGVGQKQASSYYVKSNGHRVGGIVNGITGADGRDDGTGIDYKDSANFPANPPLYTTGPWFSWRWTEQWVPHSTNFLMALVAMKDEVRTGVVQQVGVRAKPRRSIDVNFRRIGNGLEIQLQTPTRESAEFVVSDLNGRIVEAVRIPSGSNRGSISLGSSGRQILTLTGPGLSAILHPELSHP